MRAPRRVDLIASVIAAALAVGACADDGPPVVAPATDPPASFGSTSTVVTTTTDQIATTDGIVTSTPVTTTAATTTAPGGSGDAMLPRPPLTNASGESERFSGVGRLDGLGSSCTAFLLDVGEPSGPAYALTNGHCVGVFDSTTVVRDQVVDGATVRFRLFADTPSDVAVVPVDAVLYATMRGTDVAVLQLAATRSAVIGLASYRLRRPSHDGDLIRVVGVPVDGVPSDEQVLRGGTCTAGATMRVVEFEWLWDDVVANDCAGIVGGSSGSPVFAAHEPTRLVGIVNTTTIGAGPGVTCYLGQPCEVTTDGTVAQVDRTYAVPVDAWSDCFTPEWDPTAAGCPAESAPTGVGAPRRAVRSGATWDATVETASGGAVVVMSGPVATTDCREPAGYDSRLTGSTYDLPLPAGEGVYVLCAAALDAAGVPDTKQAGLAVMVVDDTPPDATISLSQVRTADGVRVEPVFAPPEYSSFDLQVGPSGEVDCADIAGYSIYRRVPIDVDIADLPATFCVIGQDEAGNRGAPRSFALT